MALGKTNGTGMFWRMEEAGGLGPSCQDLTSARMRCHSERPSIYLLMTCLYKPSFSGRWKPLDKLSLWVFLSPGMQLLSKVRGGHARLLAKEAAKVERVIIADLFGYFGHIEI